MDKQDFRDMIRTYRVIYNMRVILDYLSINYSNYSNFMAGKDNQLSVEKLTLLLHTLMNPPLLEVEEGFITSSKKNKS